MSDLPVVRSGQWYHVTNRGMNRRTLFDTDAERGAFVASIGDAAVRYPIEIHAFVVMGNHYHLLVRADEDDLVSAIEELQQEVADRVERPRLIRVAPGRHLLLVTRYIHRNPVESHLVDAPADWPWSSYRGYVDRLEAPTWLRTDAVLGWLGPIGARQQYRRMVE